MAERQEPPATAPLTEPSRAAFIFIFITVALDMLALGIIIPVLPKLIVEFESGDMAKAAAISGGFGTVWAAMQFIFAPILGSLSDRFGRRPVILLSNFGLGLDYVLMALAPTLSWLFVGRVISGITAASFPTAGAYIADVTEPDKRAQKFGLLSSAFGIGFVIGPAVGGMLGGIDLRLPFWVAGGLSLANAAYGYFILPESLPPERRAKFQWRQANPLGSLRLLRSHPELTGLAVATFFTCLAHESLPAVFVLYTDYRYAWTATTVGISLALVGICASVVPALLVRPMIEKFGEKGSMTIGFLMGAVGFAMYGLAPTGILFFVGVPFVALWGLAGPPMQSLMSRHVGANEQGQMQGALTSLRGITGMMGPLVFTQMFAAALKTEHAAVLSGSPYLFAGLLLIAAMLTAKWVLRKPVQGQS